jgi:hypothetical protein
MNGMSRKRKKPGEDTPIPATKSHESTSDSRSADRHKDRSTVSYPSQHYAALRALAAKFKRPIYWQARLLIEEAAEAEGLWPPPPEYLQP